MTLPTTPQANLSALLREIEEVEKKMTRSQWAENLDGEGWYKLAGNDMKAIVLIRNNTPLLIALAKDRIRVQEVIVKRVKSGHNDTCDKRLFPEEEYKCTCGHFEIMEALSRFYSILQEHDQ